LKYIAIPQPPNLPKKWHKLYLGRIADLAALGSHEEIAAFLTKKASWNTLKKWLLSAGGKNCWYCEASSIRAPFDVDHFRPKLRVTVERQVLMGHDGYHWLAYEWWNFRISCQRCNRPEKDGNGVLRGKANEFPLRDEAHRCGNALGSWLSEVPRLLDPCVKEDCDLLAHLVNGEISPSKPVGTWDFSRASHTIDILGLNEHNAPEVRRKSWQLLSLLIKADELVESPEARALVQAHLLDDQEYSSFHRASISIHRDKPWVNDLL